MSKGLHTSMDVLSYTLGPRNGLVRRPRITTTTYAGAPSPRSLGINGLARPAFLRVRPLLIMACLTLAACPGALVDQNPHTDTAVLRTELSGVREDISEIKTTMHDLSRAMLTLIRVEQKQVDHQDKLHYQETRLIAHDDRLKNVEADVPALKELRKWIVAGVGAISLVVVTALLGGHLQFAWGHKSPTAAVSTQQQQ